MYSSSGKATLVIRQCSWKGCGACLHCKARAAGRRAIDKHGEALLRLAD